ncbi:MAG: NAD(P)H-dependent oxidoreductase [Candidatus Sumerlaeia bacterium]|nr:NAD(P)H-dependent oxidoreductase [Candidatus Sumerlaeia bacterium]
MSTVLYIQASPRGRRSHSIAVADAFLDAYRATHPQDDVATLNLFAAHLPPFDGFAVQAKYDILHGQSLSDEAQAAWKTIEIIIAQFKAADKYVWAVPMWNFGIPYRLKQYLDLIIQPTYTFSFTPAEGYKGLVVGKRAFIAYARGGEYPEGSPAAGLDFQKRYLETALGFIGITDIRSVVCEPMLAGGPAAAAEKQHQAVAKARELAAAF